VEGGCSATDTRRLRGQRAADSGHVVAKSGGGQRARGQRRNKGWGAADEWAQAPQSRAARFNWIRIQTQRNSNTIQIISNFDRFKKDLPELKNFEIKYS
jgi:hypothetical protein